MAEELEGSPRLAVSKYRPELDGIRAIAISAVLADHLRLHSVHAGALGVDVFFVLSGYLITGLLVAEHRKTGRIDLPAFYVRRATRLFPALLAFLAAGAIIGLFDLKVQGATVVWASLIAATYVTDIMTYTRNVTWLLYAHTWSLSIEEHFYLIWPASLLVARRRRVDVRVLAIGGAFVFLIVGFLAAAPPRNGIAYDYFQPQAHAFSLLVGCSLALIAAPRLARHLVLPCLIGIAALVVFGPPLGLNYLRYAVPAVAILTCGLIAGAADAGLGRAFLACYPMRRLGAISYGLYLYHPLVFAEFDRHVHAPRLVVIVLKVAAAILVAELSYRYFESPIRSLGRRWRGSARAELAQPATA